MLARLKTWFEDKFSTGESTSANQLKGTGRHDVAGRSTKRPEAKPPRTANPNNAAASINVADPGSNKNPTTRNKNVREHTGTDETLKILDSSPREAADEDGFDPYNTGGFDRSKNWSNRSRK